MKKTSIIFNFILFYITASFAQEVSEDSFEKDLLVEETYEDKASEKQTNQPIVSETSALAEPTVFSESLLPSKKIKSPKDMEIPEPKIQIPRKSSIISVAMSSLIPGLGHTYLGDYTTASEIFGVSALSFAGIFNEKSAPVGFCLFSSSSFYGIYSAYRDTRLYNQNKGYSYPMPVNSFKEMSTAPFRWGILKKPEVWGGVLGALTIAGGLAYLKKKFTVDEGMKLTTDYAVPLIGFTAGFSEEALFRGYLQSTFSETFTPVGGIILSSLAFGAAHISNAQLLDSKQDRNNYYRFSLPFITAYGAYLGWVAYKNQSLEESIAAHSWYDVVLFSVGVALSHTAVIGRSSVGFSFSF